MAEQLGGNEVIKQRLKESLLSTPAPQIYITARNINTEHIIGYPESTDGYRPGGHYSEFYQHGEIGIVITSPLLSILSCDLGKTDSEKEKGLKEQYNPPWPVEEFAWITDIPFPLSPFHLLRFPDRIPTQEEFEGKLIDDLVEAKNKWGIKGQDVEEYAGKLIDNILEKSPKIQREKDVWVVDIDRLGHNWIELGELLSKLNYSHHGFTIVPHADTAKAKNGETTIVYVVPLEEAEEIGIQVKQLKEEVDVLYPKRDIKPKEERRETFTFNNPKIVNMPVEVREGSFTDGRGNRFPRLELVIPDVEGTVSEEKYKYGRFVDRNKVGIRKGPLTVPVEPYRDKFNQGNVLSKSDLKGLVGQSGLAVTKLQAGGGIYQIFTPEEIESIKREEELKKQESDTEISRLRNASVYVGKASDDEQVALYATPLILDEALGYSRPMTREELDQGKRPAIWVLYAEIKDEAGKVTGFSFHKGYRSRTTGLTPRELKKQYYRI